VDIEGELLAWFGGRLIPLMGRGAGRRALAECPARDTGKVPRGM
jgi:hypothetical protein